VIVFYGVKEDSPALHHEPRATGHA